MKQQLIGRVVADTGDLSHWMREYQQFYREATSTDLVPGSLNVELPFEWQMPEGPRVRLEVSQADVGMTLMPCRIEGYPAVVAPTDNNEAGVGRHPRAIIEIVPGVNLRQRLRLRDGDTVEVGVPVSPTLEPDRTLPRFLNDPCRD